MAPSLHRAIPCQGVGGVARDCQKSRFPHDIHVVPNSTGPVAVLPLAYHLALPRQPVPLPLDLG